MAEESDLERTEPATGKRLETARNDGNVPRSRELTTFAVTMGGVSLLFMQGDELFAMFKHIIEIAFIFDYQSLRQPKEVLELFQFMVLESLKSMAPILASLFIIALATPLLIGGWNLSFKAIEPKFSKINPLPGLKRMVSTHALGEGGKAVLKSFLIGGIATWVIWDERGEITAITTMSLDAGILKTIDLLSYTFFVVVSSMILLVIIDIPLQLWQYYKGLRMTKEEVKQEYKEMEGSPEVKGRIRQLQREAARRRMMQDVPSANVIVTNPTHYAVALRYEDGMAAPKVIAKGSLKVAEKIIALGKEHRVAVMRTPSFTRALYFNAEIDDDVPSALYTATAQVLAYVYQLKNYQSHGGVAPVYPNTLDFPQSLDPEQKKNKESTTP